MTLCVMTLRKYLSFVGPNVIADGPTNDGLLIRQISLVKGVNTVKRLRFAVDGDSDGCLVRCVRSELEVMAAVLARAGEHAVLT